MLEDNAALAASVAALPTPPTEFIELDMGDGLCFDAWMIKPPLFDETKKYPVLVYVCKIAPFHDSQTNDQAACRAVRSGAVAGRFAAVQRCSLIPRGRLARAQTASRTRRRS